jgi:hypothetical protein
MLYTRVLFSCWWLRSLFKKMSANFAATAGSGKKNKVLRCSIAIRYTLNRAGQTAVAFGHLT